MNARLAKAVQRCAIPSAPRGIVSIGAGAIVRSAHVAAYAKAGFRIVGVFDVNRTAARRLARAVNAVAFATLDEALAARDVVFDVAVPPSGVGEILRRMPVRSVVLVQKPFGRDIQEARALAAIVRRRRLAAAVNFQLRFSPAVRVLRALLEQRELGTMREIAVRIVTFTPFESWEFLRRAPRLEVLFHSIHYLDLARALFGEPVAVCARASRDPGHPSLSDTRSTIEVSFEHERRFTIHTNHSSAQPIRERVSEIVALGSRGSARIVLGVNLDYTTPHTDEMCITIGGRTRAVSLVGSWFPDAFVGPMANLQRFAAGEERELETNAADAVRTMSLVEACYRASARRRGNTEKRAVLRTDAKQR